MIKLEADYYILNGPSHRRLFRTFEKTFKHGPTKERDTPKLKFSVRERPRGKNKGKNILVDESVQEIRIPIHFIGQWVKLAKRPTVPVLIISRITLESGECATLELHYNPERRSGSLFVRKK